jgi:hypothetical protein
MPHRTPAVVSCPSVCAALRRRGGIAVEMVFWNLLR